MELGGGWRAIAADDTLRRSFPDPVLDDGDWAEVTVPHHWRSHPDFAASDGPLLYRRRFETPGQPEIGGRSWLQFDGLFYQGDAWMDGTYLGDTEGYFFPHCFEVTEAVASRSEHVVAIEVTCDRPANKKAKRDLTGVFQDWDCIDGDWNPGGIWRPVRLSHTGPVRIARLRVLCTEATAERATVQIRATLDAAGAGPVTVTTAVEGGGRPAREQTQEHTLAAGRNEVSWRVPVEHPALWWPHALGDQPLYDVSVSVSTGPNLNESDARTVRTGLRRFEMKDFIATVNGERLYLKGSNQGPAKRELGEAVPALIEHDVVLAREAGLDLLRVHGHISRPELYDAADHHGVLLWQDLPLQWGYARVRAQAVRQAREAIDLLGHHPSVVVWCGHNEPVAAAQPTPRTRYLARQLLPTWNKSVLDRSIHRALEKADGSRPVIAHSGVLPHPAWGTDSHLYYGWYRGQERDLPAVLARWPVLARFVSEFGAQAVPTDAGFCDPERWPDLDWARLARAYCLQKEPFDRYVPPADFATFEAWRDATQEYQAQVVRFHIEALRRLKYRPGGGFCQFAFADGQPAVTWSVLDDQRRPKAAFDALGRACAPVIVVASRPAEAYQIGEAIRLDLHVVSDLRVPITGARLGAELSWPGGNATWQFAGDVAADTCARIGTLELAAPEAEGPLLLDLGLTWAGGEAHNEYVSRVGLR